MKVLEVEVMVWGVARVWQGGEAGRTCCSS
jgi:hypothetical protein